MQIWFVLFTVNVANKKSTHTFVFEHALQLWVCDQVYVCVFTVCLHLSLHQPHQQTLSQRTHRLKPVLDK